MAVIKIKEGFECRPEGLYVFQVKNIEVRTAEKGKNAGNQFLAWESEVTESPDHPDLVGESLYHSTPLGCSPKSKYYPLFQALGAVIPEGDKELEFDTDDLIGGEFVADLIITRSGDQERNEFKTVWSVEKFTELQNKTAKLGSRLTGTPSPQVNTVTMPKPAVESSVEKTIPSRTIKGSRANITETNTIDNFPS